MTPTKVSQRPLFRVHYRKLVEDNSSGNGIYSGNSETITFIPPLSVPEYLSYSCRQCGHQQEIKVTFFPSVYQNQIKPNLPHKVDPYVDVKSQTFSASQGHALAVLYTLPLVENETEELKSIVDNAFRVAYSNHWKNQQYVRNLLTDGFGSLSTRIIRTDGSHPDKQRHRRSRECTDCHLQQQQQKLNWTPANSHHASFEKTTASQAPPSSTTSDENNSPTEMNTYKKLLKKPPHTKRVPTIRAKDALQECLPTLMRPTPEGCPSTQKEIPSQQRKDVSEMSLLSNFITSLPPSCWTMDGDKMNSQNGFEIDLSEKEINTRSVSNSTIKRPKIGCGGAPSSRPPPSPSLSLERVMIYREENELRLAPWFQAGIPREITLEVLNQEPVGTFMVRESTTKSGCYALSLRVPEDYHPRGIAHYLIIKTKKGYKIKGFTKEFSTLTALITHHSVMQELLPCPLSLSKYNPSSTKSDTTSTDFEDIDSDPDYRTLADLRKMMMDLNIQN